MTRGGKREGSGRRTLPDGQKRQPLNCRVAAETRNWLDRESERVGSSLGELVDYAVEIIQTHPEHQMQVTTTGDDE